MVEARSLNVEIGRHVEVSDDCPPHCSPTLLPLPPTPPSQFLSECGFLCKSHCDADHCPVQLFSSRWAASPVDSTTSLPFLMICFLLFPPLLHVVDALACPSRPCFTCRCHSLLQCCAALLLLVQRPHIHLPLQ